MTDTRWMDEWMRAWQSLSGDGGANPWTAALDHFTHSQAGVYQPYFADALTRITEQSRTFFDLGQTLARTEADNWQQTIFQYLDELSGRLQDDEARQASFAGLLPLEYWRQFAGHGTGASDQSSFMQHLDQLLRMPGVGYTREHEEDVRELARLWLAYESAYGEYAAYCVETARRSVERLRERLASEFDDGGGPESIRELYDAWVACCEEIHGERATTDEYVKLHGGMVNALMAYRKQAGKILDQWVRAVNLPSRAEVDALNRKLRDTQLELRDLKARLENGSGGGQ